MIRQPEEETIAQLLCIPGQDFTQPLQGDECGSCASKYGWCCYLATFLPATTTPISPYRSVSWFIDQSLFFSLTKLPSEGVPFEGTIVDDWKFDYSSHDARCMVCNDQADMTGKLLVGSLTFDCRIMHYIIVRILLFRSSNLAQAFEEDLILMWAFLTSRQID